MPHRNPPMPAEHMRELAAEVGQPATLPVDTTIADLTEAVQNTGRRSLMVIPQPRVVELLEEIKRLRDVVGEVA